MIARGFNLPWRSQDGRVTPLYDMASDYLANLGPWISRQILWLPYFRWREELERDPVQLELADAVAGGDPDARVMLADLMEGRGLHERASALRAAQAALEASQDLVDCAWLSLICHSAVASFIPIPGMRRTIVYAEQVIRETRWRETTGFVPTLTRSCDYMRRASRVSSRVPYGLGRRAR